MTPSGSLPQRSARHGFRFDGRLAAFAHEAVTTLIRTANKALLGVTGASIKRQLQSRPSTVQMTVQPDTPKMFLKFICLINY